MNCTHHHCDYTILTIALTANARNSTSLLKYNKPFIIYLYRREILYQNNSPVSLVNFYFYLDREDLFFSFLPSCTRPQCHGKKEQTVREDNLQRDKTALTKTSIFNENLRQATKTSSNVLLLRV